MKEITQIQKLLEGDFNLDKLVKFHLMLGELETALHKTIMSDYQSKLTLENVLMSYTRFKRATQGIWNNQTDIMNHYHSLLHQIKEIKLSVNNNKVLEMMSYDIANVQLDLESFMPYGPAMVPKGTAFFNAMKKFDKAYEEMMNTTHQDKLKMLREYIKIPADHQKDFIQESNDKKWDSDVNISVSYKTKESEIITKVFYLDKWEIMTSTNTSSKKDILKSTFTQDKAKGQYFWPEEYL